MTIRTSFRFTPQCHDDETLRVSTLLPRAKRAAIATLDEHYLAAPPRGHATRCREMSAELARAADPVPMPIDASLDADFFRERFDVDAISRWRCLAAPERRSPLLPAVTSPRFDILPFCAADDYADYNCVEPMR